MTTGRHPRQAPRAAKLALCVVVALAVLVSPWESGLLPAPVQDLGGAHAAAQTGWVEPGTPDDCPTTPGLYRPQPGDPEHNTASECVLIARVCPESRLHEGRYMTLSDEYPNFCEESIAEVDDGDLYSACIGEKGLAVLEEGSSGRGICRLVHPARCSAGMNRISATDCRAVQRRAWTCGEGSVPRNEFNTCYRQPPDHAGSTHPACGDGAPKFWILSCDEFVGQDFPSEPSSAVKCEDLGTVSTAMQPASSNPYWCSYDASLLDVDCHRRGASCAESPALCVKRASRTGGCDSITHTMLCRSLQAAAVSGAGCEPCAILPFQPVPADCPDSVLQQPAPSSLFRSHYDAIHRVKQDFQLSDNKCRSVLDGGPMTDACARRRKCADPARGRLTWAASHFSQVAVVNSPIILNVLDVPSTQVRIRHHSHAWRSPDRPLRLPDSAKSVALRYPDDSFAVRLWLQVPGSREAESVADLVDEGECVFSKLPQFRVVIEELWPDNPEHYGEIERLFGGNALDWWDRLDAVGRKDRAAARGLLGWWPDLTPQERKRRTEELTHETACEAGADIWCRWTPARSGYYRLKAAGAWKGSAFDKRIWQDPDDPGDKDYFMNLRKYLQDPDNRAKLRGELVEVGRIPADLGLTETLEDVLPLPEDTANWAYSDPATYRTECPFNTDVRFLCGSTTGTANYTETEYVGIQVYEIRVSTVTPSKLS